MDDEKDKRLLEIVKILPGAAYLLGNTADFPIRAVNDGFYQLFGYKPEEVRYRFGSRLTAMINTEAYRKALACGGAMSGFEHTIIKRDGEHSLYSLISPLKDDNGLLGISIEVTALAAAREALRLQDELRQLVGEQVRMEMFMYDENNQRVKMYAQAEILSGLGTECDYWQLKNRLLERFAPYAQNEQLSKTLAHMEDGANSVQCELRWQNASGEERWRRLTLRRMPGEKNERKIIAGILQDITQEKEVAEKYLKETQFYQTLLAEKEAYAHVDVTEDRIMAIGGLWNLYNEMIKTMTFTDLSAQFINKVVYPEDRPHYLEIMTQENLLRTFESGVSRLGCEFRRIVDQNKMVWMELGIHLFRESISGHLLAMLYIIDVDQRKKQSLQLRYESERDPLTNSYNRKKAEMLIREHFRQSAPDSLSALLIIDLDDFKEINDGYGHQAGDEALMRVASVLSRGFGRNDVVGRFGGDEFIVLVREVASREQLAQQLDDLYVLLEQTDLRPPLVLSIGVALTSGGCQYEQAFSQADKALYEAKCAGKRRYAFFDDHEIILPEKALDHYEVRAEQLPKIQALPSMNEWRRNELFEAFVNEQGDMAYLVQPETFELICGNKAFYDRVGLTERQCRGLRCYEVMHRRESPCPFCSKVNWSSDKFYLWKDINDTLEQDFLIKNKLVNWQGEDMLLVLAVDISNDKSVADSISSGATESQILLGGLQRMEQTDNLYDALGSILETIGCFFRADTVSLWERRSQQERYDCTYRWQVENAFIVDNDEEKAVVSRWLEEQQWSGQLMVESPEFMLSQSFGMYQIMKRGQLHNMRWLLLKENGEEYGYLMICNSAANLQNHSFAESVANFIIAEMKKWRMIEAIRHANRYDQLTDLLNRDSYETFLQCFSADEVSSLGIVAANIDDLSGINNIRGSYAGDYCIKCFASQLKDVFGLERAYRLNGDEFLVILENVQQEELEKLVGVLSQRLIQEEEYTVSMGHSWDDVEKDITELIFTAVQMMNINKKLHYDTGLISNDSQRGKMLQELMNDIEEGRFDIYLQPKVDMATYRIIGAEALIRRWDRQGNMSAPAEFVPQLEENHLVRYIDLFVLKKVCDLLKQWTQRYNAELVISLNFSRVTLLEEDILKHFEQVLAYNDISREYIEIEITESFVAGGKSTLYEVARGLYTAGCNLSLDDFGVKYTNLSLLSDIEFHTLKLDKSLIKALADKRSNQIILKNVIRLCDDLNINVIAEGVETLEQKDILQKLGCAWGQGYLFGKPMSVKEFEAAYLEKSNLPDAAQ